MSVSRPHHERTRRFRLGIVACVAATAVVATAASASVTKSSKPTLSVGVGLGFIDVDPAKNGANGANGELAFASIIKSIGASGSYKQVPGLATTWHFIQGSKNKTFEFTLRHNARFSDGTPVTAKTVLPWLKYYAFGKPLVPLGVTTTSISAVWL